MLLAATISAAASSQAEMRIQGNSTNVKIEMNFDTPTKTQSLHAMISQLSSSVFQIVVADEHQACQLARIINSDLSPCFHEQRKENDPEDTDAVVFYRNATSTQRKTAQHSLLLPKKHTSISALHPPHVLPQASQDSPDHHPYVVSETSNNTPKDLPVAPVPPTKPPPGSHVHTTPNAAVSSADRPDVLLQDNRESEPRGGVMQIAAQQYFLASVGTCTSPYTFIDTASHCEAAAVGLALLDIIVSTTDTIDIPYGCYWKQSNDWDSRLWFNPIGSTESNDSGRVSICLLEPTESPTAAPTYVGELCNFDAGFCEWTQDADDNFDWTLTSEGTPTSNTGPDTGAGGEGAFIFIEANDQTEGAYATMTSNATGCALYVDYHMYGGGIGSLTVSSRNANGDGTAWVPVWTKEGDQGDSWQAAMISSASVSYYRVTATRGGGNLGDIAIDNMNLVACTPAPTLAPTYVGELLICNFNASFCDWTQDTDDNFDWALTGEGTPTTNTGPSDGSGHVGGAFIHIEANGQTQGAYAAITSSATGCGLNLDYHMYGGDIGTLTVSAKIVAERDNAAWVPVWTKEGDQGDSWQAATIYSAWGSYYQVTATRGGGNRGDIAIDNLNLIWCSPAPTATPTNVGDTNMPTASPTAALTAAPTDAPTPVPTSTPTPAPIIDNNNILNWADLKVACSDSACDTANGPFIGNGGCTITLSDDFAMGSYSGEIVFSGKAITIWGRGKVLDDSGGGRFFNGEGAGSFLELHDAVLQNSGGAAVSRCA
jgi:hypothetical protein